MFRLFILSCYGLDKEKIDIQKEIKKKEPNIMVFCLICPKAYRDLFDDKNLSYIWGKRRVRGSAKLLVNLLKLIDDSFEPHLSNTMFVYS